jgi:hypothetical protein
MVCPTTGERKLRQRTHPRAHSRNPKDRSVHVECRSTVHAIPRDLIIPTPMAPNNHLLADQPNGGPGFANESVLTEPFLVASRK